MKNLQFGTIYFLLTYASANPWDYGRLGPDVWSDFYPFCSGHSQSPINILTACTIYRDFSPFKFLMTRNERHYFKLSNNGFTISGTIDKERKQSPIQLVGGGLNGTFEFVNFHIHWGENYKSGSEHQINSKKYPGEIHFVYQNPVTSEMAVLGIFMQSHLDNMGADLNKNHITRNEWQRYLDVTRTLKPATDLAMLDLNLALLMGESLKDFWRYKGPLTTPPCTEGVIWTVFTEPIVFMEEEFKALRDNIHFEGYRGPQPAYDRPVYRSFINETLSSVPDYNRCLYNAAPAKIQEKSLVLGLIDRSTYSFFFLMFIFYSILILTALAFFKTLFDSWRKKHL